MSSCSIFQRAIFSDITQSSILTNNQNIFYYSILSEENVNQTRFSALYLMIFFKKEINACIRININVSFHKNHDGVLRVMSLNYPKISFLKG